MTMRANRSKVVVAGRVILSVVAGLLAADAVAQYLAPAPLQESFAHVGMQPGFQRALPVVTIACAIPLAIPATSLLGAILTTGFLGGAISLHVRVDGFPNPPELICLALGGATWLGLLLANPNACAMVFPTGDARTGNSQ